MARRAAGAARGPRFFRPHVIDMAGPTDVEAGFVVDEVVVGDDDFACRYEACRTDCAARRMARPGAVRYRPK
ncbi:hypothetical protein [Lentzea guizhouensis]|uniref:hypothetical protein n=1 Tax=Lentzea guizhouensis TaxID=1586287 RepID=UPI0012B6AC25|nr:hypothetical protein [Lentzea guizhouensis]